GALARPVGVEDAVGGGVDGGGRAEGRVEDLGEVDGVVHHRAAAGEVHVGEPVPGGGELAVVGAGQPDHLAEGAVGERRPQRLDGRREVHRERGHQHHVGLAAGGDHLLGVGDGGGQGLLAQHVHAAAGGLQHEVLVVGVGAGHDDRVGSLGQGVPGLLVGGDHAHAAHVVVAVG